MWSICCPITVEEGSTVDTVDLDISNSELCLANDFFGLRTQDALISSTVASEAGGLPVDFPINKLPFSLN